MTFPPDETARVPGRFRYECWYLHERLLTALLSPTRMTALARGVPRDDSSLARAIRIGLLAEALAEYLGTSDVASLELEHMHQQLVAGSLLWLEQAVYFKGVGAAVQRLRKGQVAAIRGSFKASLSTDSSYQIRGTFNVQHLTSNSAAVILSGRRRMFILGYAQSVEANEVEIRPVAIADRWRAPIAEGGSYHTADDGYVPPSTIDQFSDVDFTTRLDKSDLDVLKSIPETSVKEAFAAIIGEPVVPKDWGGEQFDLWTTDRITVGGTPLRTAVIFKGPATFHPMTIADLGKNGDQIDRLAQSAADLLVVQHCHSVGPAVMNMLRAYANDLHNPRRYTIIDGFQTIRILRHFGRL